MVPCMGPFTNRKLNYLLELLYYFFTVLASGSDKILKMVSKKLSKCRAPNQGRA